MRDLERWKDKVELALDGRQIFFLFFGSAVFVCLVFVLGVVVGKRIEARAVVLAPASAEDPLAVLDQLGDAEEESELTFHKTLTKQHEMPAEHEAKPIAKIVPTESAPKPVAAAKPEDAKNATKSIGHFTLQLSAFPERAEAEVFMKKMQAEGYRVFLSPSEIPGKGTFFRVRVGDYATHQAALDAKSEFERKHRLPAYVAKL